jgi:small subunit ribosomal protein S6
MRRYELMLLFRPDLEDDKLQSAVEKVTRAIVNAGGTLTKVSPWGKRRMAYDIQHFREASYFLLHFDIAPSAIREIERGMLISEEILRHLVTVLVDHGGSADDELVPAALSADEAMERTEAAEAAVAEDAPVVAPAQEAAVEDAAAEDAGTVSVPDSGEEAEQVTDTAAVDEVPDDGTPEVAEADREEEEAGTAVGGPSEPRGGEA